MFWATLFTSSAAVIAALASIWLASETHIARVNDERPFVAIDVIEGGGLSSLIITDANNSYDQTMISFQTKVEAFGKSPAKQIRILCTGGPWASTVKWDEKRKYPEIKFPYVLPGRSIEVFCPQIDDSLKTTRETDLVEYGVVYYEDQEGNKYKTPFCQYFFTTSSGRLHTMPCLSWFNLPELK